MQNQVYGPLMKFFEKPNKQIIQVILRSIFFKLQNIPYKCSTCPLKYSPFFLLFAKTFLPAVFFITATHWEKNAET